MQKFLSIPVTGEQSQLVSANDIKIIEQATTTTVTITYGGGKVTTLTHATAAMGSEEMRDAIQDGVVSILSQRWTNVSIDLVMPKAVSAIAIA
jgi:azurin